MKSVIDLEDIRERRREQAIDDVELCEQIEHLSRGDFVKLTFLDGIDVFTGETLLVRITSVRNGRYRGKLAQKPGRHLASVSPGCAVVFTQAHIHSVAKGPLHHER